VTKQIQLLICDSCELYSFLREKTNCFLCGKFMRKEIYTKEALIDFGFECFNCDIQFDHEFYEPVFYKNDHDSQAVMCSRCFDRKIEVVIPSDQAYL